MKSSWISSLGSTSQGVIDFRPSDETKTRVADLIRRQKTTSLSPDETAELNQNLQIEHLLRLAKAREFHSRRTRP